MLQLPRVLDLKNAPYGGFLTDGNNTVTKINSDSPAELAGFMVGDYITSNGDISTEDTRALVRRSRADIGETRTFVVRRSGESANLNLTFSGMIAPKVIFPGDGFHFLTMVLIPVSLTLATLKKEISSEPTKDVPQALPEA